MATRPPVHKRPGRGAGSRWWAYHLVVEGNAFGIVFRKPGFRGVGIREDLEVIGVCELLARIHVDQLEA
jgi:hypothetical protein